MSEIPIQDIMQAYAADAVGFAKQHYQIDLDYSESSLEQVEYILRDVYSDLHRGLFSRIFRPAPSSDEIWQMAKMWGGYIGEVIRLRWGGEWASETAVHPGVVITLEVLGSDIYPPAKAHKRLLNGPEDNIWHYYQILTRHFQEADRAS